MFRVPRPAPRWNSPRPAMSASLATWTWLPVACLSIAASGTLRQPGRFGGLTRMPRSTSMGPGAPMALLRTFSRPRFRSISDAAHSTTRCGVPSSGVFVLKLAISWPSERASATRTWVPPRSMPASMACNVIARRAGSGSDQLLAPQRGQDLDRRPCPVEGVEVQPGYARFEQLGALRDAMLDTEPSDGIVVGLFVDRSLQC